MRIGMIVATAVLALSPSWLGGQSRYHDILADRVRCDNDEIVRAIHELEIAVLQLRRDVLPVERRPR